MRSVSGTSTFDGISIAWSIAEFLHNQEDLRPKTMFATHYHELNELAAKYPRIHNFQISTKESGSKVIFLRKLIEGGSHHSFGIHVARMAGMPKEIVLRANDLLHELEKKSVSPELSDTLQSIESHRPLQLDIFDHSNPQLQQIQEALEKLDINSMTPVEALLKLNELKKLLEG